MFAACFRRGRFDEAQDGGHRGRHLRSARVIGTAFEVPHGIATVDGATFDSSVLAAPGPVAVEFMSYGCAHCRALEPIIEHVATLLAGREAIVRVNVAIEHELADRYAIEVTPTMLMFLDGREAGRRR
jgi:thioredoxin 1